MSCTTGAPERRQLGDRDRRGEALDAEVARVHLEDAAGVGADRGRVVGEGGAVRRADLTQPRAGARDQVGQPEPVADLDHLAAADDDLATGGQRGRGEHQRGRAVVDDERGLGLGHRREERGAWCPGPGPSAGRWPRSSSTSTVPAAADHRLDRGGRQRRPAEVGVHHDAGRVEHRRQGGRPRSAARPAPRRRPSSGPMPAGPHLLLRRLHRSSARRRGRGARSPAPQRVRRARRRCGARGDARRAHDWAAAAAYALLSCGGGGRESNPPSRDARLHRF